MAKPNYRQKKKQRELTKKKQTQEKEQRRREKADRKNPVAPGETVTSALAPE